MSLNIANPKVEEKAILASRILGTNKTAAVEQALDYFLKHRRPDSERGTDIREVSRLLDELADLPILDNRKADEIIGYNEDGVPCG
jgi:antitoxin VapB